VTIIEIRKRLFSKKASVEDQIQLIEDVERAIKNGEVDTKELLESGYGEALLNIKENLNI
jgi:hypothetical protein